MKKKHIKWAVWLFQMAIFFVPVIWISLVSFNTLNPKKLSGTYWAPSTPKISFQSLESGTYTNQVNDYLKETWPYRAYFVRLKNQVDYQLFNQPSNDRIVVGEEGHLFEKSYIDAWMGEDLMNADSARTIVQKLALIRDSLLAHNTQLLVLMPPGKPTVSSQLLPNYYHKKAAKITNQKQFSRLLTQSGIAHEDFSFLSKGNSTSSWPLFPKGGLHWSLPGAVIAADSMSQHFYSDSHFTYSFNSQPNWEGTDFELERAMNLLYQKANEESFSPIIEWKTDSLQDKKRVIVMGDSYYKIWYDLGIHQGLFTEGSEFWYYGRTIFPKRIIDKKEVIVSNLNVWEEWKKADFIILQNSETNLPRLGFELIDPVYNQLYKPQ